MTGLLLYVAAAVLIAAATAVALMLEPRRWTPLRNMPPVPFFRLPPLTNDELQILADRFRYALEYRIGLMVINPRSLVITSVV